MNEQLKETMTPYAEMASKVYAAIKLLEEVQNDILLSMTNRLGLDKDQAELLIQSLKESIK